MQISLFVPSHSPVLNPRCPYPHLPVSFQTNPFRSSTKLDIAQKSLQLIFLRFLLLVFFFFSEQKKRKKGNTEKRKQFFSENQMSFHKAYKFLFPLFAHFGKIQYKRERSKMKIKRKRRKH